MRERARGWVYRRLFFRKWDHPDVVMGGLLAGRRRPLVSYARWYERLVLAVVGAADDGDDGG